jgi:tetratricopeptide (TPR) repeat protein
MITAALALGSRSQATEYYKQLQQLDEYIQSDTSSAYSQLSNALILKSSHRLRDQMESQKLLEEILNDDKQVPWTLRILTLKNLCSLLLLEVEVNNDPEVFIEVKTKIAEIKEIAEKQHLFPVWIETLLFQAKLALVDGNLEEAEPILLKAEEMAINMELGQMRRLVTEERKRLDSDLEKWEDLTNSNAPLRERIEKARLMDYTKIALDVRDTWTRRSIDQKMGRGN